MTQAGPAHVNLSSLLKLSIRELQFWEAVQGIHEIQIFTAWKDLYFMDFELCELALFTQLCEEREFAQLKLKSMTRSPPP